MIVTWIWSFSKALEKFAVEDFIFYLFLLSVKCPFFSWLYKLKLIFCPIYIVEPSFRAASAFCAGSLEPIGPPKRRKVAAPSPIRETESSWQNMDILKAATDNNGRPDSYFAILSDQSPWSPWMSHSFASGFGFGDKVEPQQQQGPDEDLACGLRQIVQQSNTFFSGPTIRWRQKVFWKINYRNVDQNDFLI